VTEDEAKKRWCPFAASRSVERGTATRHITVTSWLTNKDEPDSFNIRCIGSDCMAWRWKHVFSTNDAHRPSRPDGVVATVDVIGETETWHLNGYCGLAGK